MIEGKKEPPLAEILLVDDEPSVLLALKLLLEALGYAVRDFVSAPDAIEFLKNGGSCDLFICDLKMPKMNGINALRESKKVKPEVPFVLMSAHANNEEVRLAKELGASGFLAKPFSPEQLHQVVRDIKGRAPA